MIEGVQKQKESFNDYYSNRENWSCWDDSRPLTKYILGRRLQIGIEHLRQMSNSSLADWNVLIICGGVGGEGSIVADMGVRSVTISDVSERALEACRSRDTRLKTILLNAENLALADKSYDLVLVMDGLHHLPRPVLGFTEMMRVAKKAVIVIEPHTGIVANLLGRKWEEQNGEINWVFRWNKILLEQAARSYILQSSCYIKAIRLWNHNQVMFDIARLARNEKAALSIVKLCYFWLDLFLRRFGNMMIGVIVFEPETLKPTEPN